MDSSWRNSSRISINSDDDSNFSDANSEKDVVFTSDESPPRTGLKEEKRKSSVRYSDSCNLISEDEDEVNDVNSPQKYSEANLHSSFLSSPDKPQENGQFSPMSNHEEKRKKNSILSDNSSSPSIKEVNTDNSSIISEDEDEDLANKSSKMNLEVKTYTGFIPNPEKLQGKGNEVVGKDLGTKSILISDEVPGSFPNKKSVEIHPQNLSEERQAELINAKKFYELELIKEKASLENLKTTVKSIKIETLPDRGAKLRSSIEKQVQKVKEINEQLSHVSSNIVDKSSAKVAVSKPSKSDYKLPSIIDLTKDYVDISKMGEKALATHQAQQSQTVTTLEKLHKFLRSSTDQEDVEDPKGLKVPLLPHQRTGLAWLLKREKEYPSGGILADDMGLGKTLTMISLMLKDQEDGPWNKNPNNEDEDDEQDFVSQRKYPKGKTLVICPSSVMGQWGSEVQSKVRGGHLSVYTHHGTKRESRAHGLTSYDVVITTYCILQHENKRDKPGPLLNVRWNRIILDEGHTIRNHKSQTAIAVFALRAKKKWVLTGTPIQNKQEDFFALLKFLKCKPFDDIVIWKKMIDNRRQSGMERLHLLTKSLLLRRTKDEIQQAGGLKGLKPKEFSIVEVKLDPEEFKVYDKISQFSRTLLAQYIEQKASKENLLQNGLDIRRTGPSNPFEDHPELGNLYNKMLALRGGVKTHHILVLLLRLRQACCHPSLVTSLIDDQDLGKEVIEDDEGNDMELIDQMMDLSIVANSDSGDSVNNKSPGGSVFKKNRCSSKLRAVIDCILGIMESKGDKIIVVSQWTSVLEILNAFLAEARIRTVSLNGTIPVKDRIGIIEGFNNDKSKGPKVLLLSLTAGGTGLNLVGANHLLLIDIHWNPQLEAQACDRIYRVGQTKTVYIYKFLCKETIEERILKLQNQKLELAKGVLTGSGNMQSSKLTLRDLKLLFDIKH